MKFGAHVSAAGGVFNAPVNAAKAGCECFQFFSRSPQGGPAPKLTPEIIAAFKTNCKKYKQTASYIHAPYFINFASALPRIKHGSVSIIRQELERGSALGVTAMMTHLGSAKDLGEAKGVAQTIAGLIEVLTGYTGSTELLLENSAGAGAIIGDTFDELGEILKAIKKKLPTAPIGICLDTCHAFASGYDWSDAKALATTLKDFDKHIGLEYLKLFHFNDSLTELNAQRDRHAHLGKGKIGATAFKLIVQHPKLKHLNAILETPTETGRVADLKLLKTARK
ncbi:deoxyribonuclease IV [Candidatus Falkowbacteria bacterium]|nr:deoxyribonuclease IV [Candidatus Falkowbacteria bacterium]